MTLVHEAPRNRASTTLALVLLVMAWPAFYVVVTSRLFDEPSVSVAVALQTAYCGLAVAILAIALHSERSSPASLGVKRPTWQTLALAAALLVIVQFLAPLATTPVIQFFGTDAVDAQVRTLARLPIWLRVVMAVTGGAIEEALYRGYATDRLVRMTGSRWIGGGLAAVGFGLAHIPAWGSVFALAADLPMGVLMTMAYIWRRDLIANILAHSTGLLVGMLALPVS